MAVQRQWPALSEVVNVASVPKRSPFRYPGGKTWLVPQIRRWMRSHAATPSVFVEPFAGGGIAGLTVSFEHLAGAVVLSELDPSVAVVWQALTSGKAEALAAKILAFDLTPESVREFLDRKPRSLVDKAFTTILRNRVQHGGILAQGASMMREGESGKGISSRWYPATLAKRIRDIDSIRNRLTFQHEDAFDVINSFQGRKDVVFFVDPPYRVAGKRLYDYSMVDHKRLFDTMASVQGDFLMTC